MRKYRVKKNVPTRLPKKSKKADLNRWTGVFFLFGLGIVVWGFYYAFIYKTITYVENGNNSVAVPVTPPPAQSEDTEEKVLVINPEEIENIVNTEAFTHAVWPGYKGKITDGSAVRRHFADNLAAVIINTGGIQVRKTYKVHFYYVVRDDGAIQFLSLVGGGVTTEGVPSFVIEKAQRLVNIGIPGIKPGTDANGEPITVVYELAITFKPSK